MRVLLIGMAKKENLYIKEWVDYHLSIGFDYILIGDNNYMTGEKIEDVISISDKVGIINLRNQFIRQVNFYNWAYEQDFCHDYDWILFLDIDEFFVLKKDNTIQEYLSRDCFKEFNCIKVHWQMYDDNDLIYYEDKPVMERFIRPVTHEIPLVYKKTGEHQDMNWFVKSIVRPFIKDVIWDVAPQPVPRYRWPKPIYLKVCNGAGEALDDKYIDETVVKEENRELAQINHYRTKTIEEYISNKCTRGWPITDCNTKEFVESFLNLSFFYNINQYTEEKQQAAIEIMKKYNLNLK